MLIRDEYVNTLTHTLTHLNVQPLVCHRRGAPSCDFVYHSNTASMLSLSHTLIRTLQDSSMLTCLHVKLANKIR